MRLIGLGFMLITLAGGTVLFASGCGTTVKETNGPDGGASDAAPDGTPDAAVQDAAADGSPGDAGVAALAVATINARARSASAELSATVTAPPRPPSATPATRVHVQPAPCA